MYVIIIQSNLNGSNIFGTKSMHYENTPIQIYTENFTIKNWKFSDKNSDIFHICAQNIDCGTR